MDASKHTGTAMTVEIIVNQKHLTITDKKPKPPSAGLQSDDDNNCQTLSSTIIGHDLYKSPPPMKKMSRHATTASRKKDLPASLFSRSRYVSFFRTGFKNTKGGLIFRL